MSYVDGSSKSSVLFINLLQHLEATYRWVKTITLIVENYVIHQDEKTQNWLKKNPKIRGFINRFLTAYKPR
ncbi:hypothetical protein NN294_001036 [Escherichia albertii]|nr:hypothetical protein [Escherichia albertii]EJM1766587.1 hypothetical protein [Escherichia albertii]EJM2114991.1 hypothetical protein [Escherichia albertii]EJO0116856.1 hypothetical protein [Escherichia albertii]